MRRWKPKQSPKAVHEGPLLLHLGEGSKAVQKVGRRLGGSRELQCSLERLPCCLGLAPRLGPARRSQVHLAGELPSAKLRVLEAQLEAPDVPLCAPQTLCFQIKNVGAWHHWPRCRSVGCAQHLRWHVPADA